jgi:hypothetical protein
MTARAKKRLKNIHGRAAAYAEPHIVYGSKPVVRPDVVGAGPAGLSRAHAREARIQALLIERGGCGRAAPPTWSGCENRR